MNKYLPLISAIAGWTAIVLPLALSVSFFPFDQNSFQVRHLSSFRYKLNESSGDNERNFSSTRKSQPEA
jgi:hypothetical protein